MVKHLWIVCEEIPHKTAAERWPNHYRGWTGIGTIHLVQSVVEHHSIILMVVSIAPAASDSSAGASMPSNVQAVILNTGFTWGRHQRRRSNVEPAYCQRSAREHGADEPWAERRDNCIRLALNEGQNYVTSLKKATLYSVITQSHNAVAAHFSRGQLLSLVLRNVLGYAVHCGDGSADPKVINQGRVHFS